MGWDEALFGWLHRAVERRRSAPKPEVLARRVTLTPQIPRLRVLASALAERPISIQVAKDDGALLDDVLFLPPHFDGFETPEQNQLAFALRVAFATTAARLTAPPCPADAPADERALAALFVAREVLEALSEELPAAHESMTRLAGALLTQRPDTPRTRQDALGAWVAARLGLPLTEAERQLTQALDALPFPDAVAQIRRLPGALRAFPLFGGLGAAKPKVHAEVHGAEDSESLPSGKEHEGMTVEQVRRHEAPKDTDEPNPLTHSFEKVHTAEEYRGGSKPPDGEDDLDDHLEALENLDLRDMMRSDERTRSLLRVDVMLEGGVGDLAEGASKEGIPYPEWHHDRRAYRAAWCRVRVAKVKPRLPDPVARASIATRLGQHRREVDAICGELDRLTLERRWSPRQLDGAELDEDALVDRLACVAARTTPPERLHRDRRRALPTLAALLLVDSSLSTDGWVDDTRILDLEIDSTLALGEALASRDVELEVAAFSSHTRSDCRFNLIKSFDESWAATRHRLLDINPDGYTRIGPALRHATSVLSGREARRRLLMLLTDGKPNDYDRYEGRHGVADVRQAVREADALGITVHALAIDRDARFHLPRMFGGGRYSLFKHPSDLAALMSKVVAEARR
ncbi:MAG: VWA domain-containing protein [Polyangiaceae bacterium]|nr:VWA domain-containing protein [Polyangiaceae bacterium]MCW5789171.1 VWA domain-containing protein [Polyangiaceae bacterium]